MLVGKGKLVSNYAENPLFVYMFCDASQPKNPAYMLKTQTRNTAENASGSKKLRKWNRIVRATPLEFLRISCSLSHDWLVEACARLLSRAIIFS